jgi:hypothetical protein
MVGNLESPDGYQTTPALSACRLPPGPRGTMTPPETMVACTMVHAAQRRHLVEHQTSPAMAPLLVRAGGAVPQQGAGACSDGAREGTAGGTAWLAKVHGTPGLSEGRLRRRRRRRHHRLAVRLAK